MNATLSELEVPQSPIDRALALSPAAMKKLAALLLDRAESQPGFTISPEWRAEIARRIEVVRSGEMGTIPAEESIARIRRIAAEGATE